jgi:hypothetical protein
MRHLICYCGDLKRILFKGKLHCPLSRYQLFKHDAVSRKAHQSLILDLRQRWFLTVWGREKWSYPKMLLFSSYKVRIVCSYSTASEVHSILLDCQPYLRVKTHYWKNVVGVTFSRSDLSIECYFIKEYLIP